MGRLPLRVESLSQGRASRTLAALALAGCASCGGEEAEPRPAARDAVAGASGASDARAARAGALDEEGAAAVRFLARREAPVAGKPVGLLARDCDGDGIDDVLVVTRAPGALVLLRGTREGFVQEGAARPLGDDYALGPLDLGADGLAVALQGERAVLWFAEPLDDAPLRFELDAAPRALGAGDADGDGLVELLAATAGDELVIVGRDGSRSVVTLPHALRGRATFLHVFSDGGGVAVGAQLGEALYVYERSALLGHGESAQPRARLQLDGIPRAAREADLDGDGDAELVIAGGDQSVWVLGAGAAGGPSAWSAEEPARRLKAPGAVPVDLERADLDRDGRPELVLIDFYDSGYGVLGSFAPGGAPRLATNEYAGQDPVDGAAGDFDGDGKLDLAVANRNAARVSLLLGSGLAEPERNAFYQALRVPTRANPTRVAAGNLDADPLPEVVALCAGDPPGALVVRLNRMGLLQSGGEVVRPELAPRAFAVGDADGDGAADIAVLEGDAGRARVVVYAGDGAGGVAGGAGARTFEVGAAAEELLFFAESAGAGAGADAGRKAMLAVLDPSSSAVDLLALGEQGEAARRVALEAPPKAAVTIAVGGAERLAVLTHADVVLVDANGAVTQAARVPAPADHAPHDIAAADFDGDGREDLALLYSHERDTAPGRISVLAAVEGAATFRPIALLETGLAPARIAAGDVNGDGRAEIFCAAQNSHNVNVWTAAEESGRDGGGVGGGAGAGVFSLRRLGDLGAGLGPLDVELVDLDGDGRLDLVTANSFSDDLSVAYNLSEIRR